MDPATPVTLPFGRLEALARKLDDPRIDVCPSYPHECFSRRGIKAYVGDAVHDDCANCIIHYLLTGE